MPSNAEEPVLVDTSAAVPFLVTDHDHHPATFDALAGHTLGLAGHAAFETFSVLTRLPPPTRQTSASASRLLAANFPATRFLSAEGAQTLLAGLADRGVAGGSVYDALVATAAVEHSLILATRDRRAQDVYRVLGVRTWVLR